MRAGDRRTIVLLAAVTAFAAALRLVAIDAKGFWGDEISTVFLVHRPYGDMLDHVARLESTPPLYYSLAWLWAKLFGTTEAGLRSLSALVGAGTVPLAYGAAQELVSRRGALYAATLAAASPVLVWYSDEARAYMLLVFLGAGALWCFARTLKSSSRLALALWAAASSLAVLTHYFAVFLAIPEATVLLRRCAVRREAIAAVATVGAACAAIFPLALRQASYGHAAWIAHSSLIGRLASLPGDLVTGFDAGPPLPVGLAAITAIAVAGTLAVRRAVGADRSGAAVAGRLVAGAVALPVALALVGVDYISARNSLAVTVPLLIAVGAGYAAGSRTGRIAMAGVVALSIGIVIAGAGQPKFHSEDWRSAAEDLGRSSHRRAVVATPGQAGRKPLEYYLGAARLGWTRSVRVVEVDIVVMPPQGESRVARRELIRLLRLRLPGFRRARTHLERNFAVLAYSAPRPEPVSQAMLDERVRRGAATVVVGPRRAASTDVVHAGA